MCSSIACWLFMIFVSYHEFTTGRVVAENITVKSLQLSTTPDEHQLVVPQKHLGNNSISSIINEVKSCKSELCMSAFHGAKCFVDSRNRTDFAIPAAIYLCSGFEIWQINVGISCSCRSIFKNNETVNSMTADQDGLHWISDDMKMYETLQLNVTFVKSSSPISSSSGPQQSAFCSLLPAIKSVPDVIAANGSVLSLNFSSGAASTNNSCSSTVIANTSLPIYSVLYTKNDVDLCIGDEHCNELVLDTGHSANHHQVEINNLKPKTEYFVQVLIKRQFSSMLLYVVSPHVLVNTTCGVSSPPSKLTCEPQTHEQIKLKWEAPVTKNSAQLQYTVVYDGTSYSVPSPYFKHSPLENVSLYQVRAYAVDCDGALSEYSSAEVHCSPFESVHIRTANVTSHTITVAWNALPPNQVAKIVVLWSLATTFSHVWKDSLPLRENATRDTITDLISGTGYRIRANITYVSGKSVITKSTSAQTSPGAPNAPANVRIVGVTPDGVLQWNEPSSSNGNSLRIKEYVVEARNRSSPSSHRRLFGAWKEVESVSARADRLWKIKDLVQNEWYEFRIYAENELDVRGDTSLATEPPYQFTLPADNSRFKWIVIGSSVGTAVIILIVVLALVCYKCSVRRRRKRIAKQLPGQIATIHINYGTDMELAEIRHMTSLAMAAAQNDGRLNLPNDYMKKLPLFPRDKLALDGLLGSGAFGEVYKGIAIDIKGGEAGIEYPVAVKTLKDGASDSEKCEFLMEAYFMSLFDHPNIISLLGVCLDNEPQYLILELMEGGDLLKYLRNARPSQILGSKLKLMDLIDIGLDLAAGCQYLESQHFIHRDLAARNCLVSTKAFRTNDRIVKIGDFGLARDIYRNDYYHKEGEGLLPVRWMAPENLTRKIYTVQSDVWAFGVLLWEVLTFGQQPYPALTNLEVIGFVKEDGRLEQPSKCPDVLYATMRKCWSIEPADRPSFQEILQMLRHCKVELPATGDYTIEAAPESDRINYTLVSPDKQNSDDSEDPTVKYFDNNAFVFDEDDTSQPQTTVSYNSPSYESSGNFPFESITTPYTNNFLRPSRSSPALHADTVTTTAPANELNYAHFGFAPSRETSVRGTIPHSSTENVSKAAKRDADRSVLSNLHVQSSIDSTSDPAANKRSEENSNALVNGLLNRSKNKAGNGEPRNCNQATERDLETDLNYHNSLSRAPEDEVSTKQLHHLSNKEYVNELTKHWNDGTATSSNEINQFDLTPHAKNGVTYL